MTKMTFQDIPDAGLSNFELWGGEMGVSVFQQIGAHGFPSAAIVVIRMDDPIQTFSWSGYTSDRPKPTVQEMKTWIADKLNGLATGVNGISSIKLVAISINGE